MYYYHTQWSVDEIFLALQYRLGFFFWGGGGGGDLNVLRTYTDTIHASDKRLIAKIGLDLVGSLLSQISTFM